MTSQDVRRAPKAPSMGPRNQPKRSWVTRCPRTAGGVTSDGVTWSRTSGNEEGRGRHVAVAAPTAPVAAAVARRRLSLRRMMKFRNRTPWPSIATSSTAL